MNDTFCVEAFVDYCDEMMIAEEGFIETIKVKLVKLFTRFVRFLSDKVNTMKDGVVKQKLLSLLAKAKSGLAKSKALNNNDKAMAEELQREAERS